MWSLIVTTLSNHQIEIPSRLVWRNLALLMILGIALRVFAGEVFGGGLSTGFHGDERDYATLASHVIEGQGFVDRMGVPSSYRTPGLPLLLAMLISITGPNIPIMRLFMCVLGSLLIPACYLLGRSATGSQRIGMIVAVVAVFFPTWVIPSSSIESDITAAVMVTFLAWMLIEGHQRQSLRWLVGAGVIWGAVTLVRAVTLVYVPAIVVWFLLITPSWKKALAATAAVLVPFVCILGPWLVRNTQVHGSFVGISTQGGTELYISNNADATGILAIDYNRFVDTLVRRYPKEKPDEVTRSKQFQADALNFIRHNPWRFVQLCMVRFVEFWKIYSSRVQLLDSLAVIATFGLALPFFLLQIGRCGWRRGPDMLLLMIILCHTSLHVVFTSIVRYRIPIEPLVIVMATAGLSWTLSFFHHTRLNSNMLLRESNKSAVIGV